MLRRLLIIFAAALLLAALGVAVIAWWLFDSQKYAGPALQGRMEVGSLEHDGLTRTWETYLPARQLDRPPVLFVLHGSKGEASQMPAATFRAFDILAEQEGFIPVYVDGFEKHWNDCRANASYSANLQNINDVGFFRLLVRQLQATYGIDPGRIYVTGISNGGHMAYRLGLEAPDLVAGIASIAANLPVADNLDCRPSGEPMATLIINGTEDPINPYSGGVVEILNDASRGLVMSSEATAAYWARLAGASAAGKQRRWPDLAPDDGTSVYSTDWFSQDGVPVTLVTVVGGGHVIPHSDYRMPRILGRTSHEFTAANVIWSFFNAQDYVDAANRGK